MDGLDGFDGSRVLGRSPSSLDRIKAVLMQADFSEDLGRLANLDAPPHVMPAWVPQPNRAATPSAAASLASPPSWSGVAKAVLEAAAAQGEGE
ncbi:hypothetical protein HaLaN_32592, partial [Haematococcus lacustris]